MLAETIMRELTVVADFDGCAGNEDREGILSTALRCGLENVLGLSTGEGGRGTGRLIDDREAVRRELVEGAAGVVEQLERLVTSVDEGGLQLQVVHAVNGGRA